jgi:hypothetical protein
MGPSNHIEVGNVNALMKNLLLAGALALGWSAASAQMMGNSPISTTGYMPLADGAHYEYMFTRGPWSSATAHLRGGQTWAGQSGLTAMHMSFTCVPGVQCPPDSTGFYRMDPDGTRYFGGASFDGSLHFSMMSYTSPEWSIQNPLTPGTMMPGGGYQNMGSWSANVAGTHSMMGNTNHMSRYQAMALETVTTPAGTFANALHVREQRGSEVRDVWYVQNVGIVMMSDATSTMLLTGYTIPGGTSPAAGSATPLGFTPTTGVWWNPGESGTGYNIQVQRGTMIVQMYTYDASGSPLWYLGVAPLRNSGTSITGTGTLDKYAGGQCATCSYRAPSMSGNDGAFTMAFTAPSRGTLTLPGGRTVEIQPMAW